MNLKLNNSKVTKEIVLKMLDLAIEGDIRFKTLDLSNNSIVDDEVCEKLSKLLEMHSPIVGLTLDGTDITARGVALLI